MNPRALPTLPTLFATALLAAPFSSAFGSPAAHGHSHAEPIRTDHVQIVERNGYRYITSDGLPDHPPGQFPTRGNPNTISAQKYAFRVTMDPQPTDEPPPRGKVLFGVALNGVPFEPGTAEVWSPQGRTQGQGDWRYEAMTGGINLGLDGHHAHVQPSGAYHYHALPTGLYERLAGRPVTQAPDQMVLLGYAADGFPFYGPWGHADADDAGSDMKKLAASYRVKEGSRPTGKDSPGGAYDGTYTADWEYVEGLGDLDEHNGRIGVTPEYPAGIYYYVLTETHPYIPRSFYGTPDASFVQQRGERRGREGRQGRQGREGRGAGSRRGGQGPPPAR